MSEIVKRGKGLIRQGWKCVKKLKQFPSSTRRHCLLAKVFQIIHCFKSEFSTCCIVYYEIIYDAMMSFLDFCKLSIMPLGVESIERTSDEFKAISSILSQHNNYSHIEKLQLNRIQIDLHSWKSFEEWKYLFSFTIHNNSISEKNSAKKSFIEYWVEFVEWICFVFIDFHPSQQWKIWNETRRMKGRSRASHSWRSAP